MRTTSQTTQCIACGGPEVTLQSMHFMSEEGRFPICGACALYLERIFADPTFGRGFLEFIGVTEMGGAHQLSPGAFSWAGPDSAVPPDLEAKMNDFDLHCDFMGQRIRELRSRERN